MPRFSPSRSASLAITLFSAITNCAIAIHVLAAWRSLKWERESEWETSGDIWKADGVKLVWGLLAAYFTAAATVCFIGFAGIVKSKPAFVRFYRDYSIADFSFTTFFTVLGTYAAFRTSVRTAVCEELTRQPELMRDMLELGLNLENCELWFERAVLVSMAVMVILIVVRLHFLMAVSNYYSHLTRHPRLPTHRDTPNHTHSRSSSRQRIYLLPTPTPEHPLPPNHQPDVQVYAPVPLASLSPETAQHLRSSATEAWISRTEPHRHRHHHHSDVGRISLPISPDEGLLPSYDVGKA